MLEIIHAGKCHDEWPRDVATPWRTRKPTITGDSAQFLFSTLFGKNNK